MNLFQKMISLAIAGKRYLHYFLLSLGRGKLLTLRSLPEPPVVEATSSGVKKVKGNEYEVEKNQQMILICDVVDGYPPPNMTWLKDGGEIPKEADTYKLYDGKALK